MFSVNVLSMEIPITIFICIAISAAQSTGSDSSILESKIRGGFRMGERFNLLYTGFLISKTGRERMALLTFINECNCITTSRWGAEVSKFRQLYEVRTSAHLGEQEYNISSVLVPDDDYYVAAYFSIIKLNRFLENPMNPTNYIRFVNTRVQSFKRDGKYYVGGWDKHHQLRYLTIQLKKFKDCKITINRRYKRTIHNLACAYTPDGYFDRFDKGTPLFMSNNEILGVAVEFRETAAIFALVYNDVQLIKAFINHDGDLPVGAGEGTGGYTGGDTSVASGESSNAHYDPRCGADTSYLYDTSPMNLGHMGTPYQYDMGHMNPAQMSTPHLPDMTHLSLDQMGYPHLSDTSHMNLGPMGTSYPYDIGHMTSGQIGTSHLPDTSNMNLRNIGSYFSGHTSSEYEPDTDDLMSIVRPPKPIKTRREQSSDAHQTHDGSRSARLSGTMFENPDVQAGIRVADTSRATGVKLLRNPRTRGHLPKK